MEKIRLGEIVYDLVPAGAYRTGEHLKIILVWPKGNTYEDIEASLNGCDRIEILAENDDLLEAIKGYTCLIASRKQYDYVIGTEQIQGGEDGKQLFVNKDITGTVMIATLSQPSVREHLEKIEETVDMLVMDALM